MSKKSTKIIAAAGVVAGLGVAALPAMTFAAETVNGSVDLYVDVVPAIAMTISGNNDDNSHYGTAGDNGAVDVFNPATAASSSIDGHTTPAAPTTVASSSWASLLPNATVNGNDTNGFKSTINVYTNNASGYTLNVKDSDSTLALTKVGSTETIPAGVPESGDTTFDLSAGIAAWGYKIDTASTTGAGYTPISATDAQVKTRATKTSGGEETVVYYGVATASDQATGTYADTIVYTATTNN